MAIARHKKFRARFGAKFFEVDIFDDTGRVITRVGSAKMRVIRRQSNYVKVVAKRSMRRQKRYRSEAELPPHIALNFRKARWIWHLRGEEPRFEPKVSQIRRPSPRGKPPSIGRNPLLKRFLFAQPTQSGRNTRGGSYVVGPKLLPRASKSRGPSTVPEVHEHSGVRVNTASLIYGNRRTAYYPKRPFMMPALRVAAPTFAKMWKDKVKP
jgi:hypothetical protein